MPAANLISACGPECADLRCPGGGLGGLPDPQGPQAPRRGHPQPLGRTLLARRCACSPVASRSAAATPASSSRPSRQPSATTVETKASSAAPTQPSYAARRAAAAKATKRRRNVLGLILLVNAVVIGLAVAHVARLALGRRPRRPARRLAGRLPGDGQGRARRRPTGQGRR